MSASGRASYTFSVNSAGNYVIQVDINAPGDASNSLYVNIDGEPTDPTMIWDIPPTSGFEQRTANWRGSGTFDADEFVPKVFSLSAGSHQLIVRGREGNVRFDEISIVKTSGAAPTPAPPQNLRVLTSP